MKVSEYQMNLVIKTYLKNNKDRTTNISQLSDQHNIDDAVNISDEGKTILFERMGKQLKDRVREQASLNP
jgi:hypothetical protein